MHAYIKDIIDNKDKYNERKASWSIALSKRLHVKPDKRLPKVMLDLILNTSRSLAVLDGIEGTKDRIVNDLIPALKEVIAIYPAKRYFNSWKAIAKSLCENLCIKDPSILYLEEIPITSHRQYADWVCTMSEVTMQDTILFPKKVQEKYYDLEYIFSSWASLFHTKGKDIPKRFKDVSLQSLSMRQKVNLINNYGCEKMFEMFPILLIKERSVANEIEYMNSPSLLLISKSEALMKKWREMHPDLSIIASLIYSDKLNMWIDLDRYKEEDKKLDKNNFSYAMAYVIVNDVRRIDDIPYNLRQEHIEVYGDIKYLQYMIHYRTGKLDLSSVNTVPYKEARHPEDRCPICYTDFTDTCEELPCGHVVCKDCLGKIDSCVYRCKFEDTCTDEILKNACTKMNKFYDLGYVFYSLV